MACKVISQETFDEAFKENLELAEGSVDEARKETIEQFVAMGVNLGNIITDLTINENTGVPVINEIITTLKNLVDGSENLKQEDIKSRLEILNTELSKSVPHRVHAFKLNVKDYLIELIQREIEDKKDEKDSLLNEFLKTINYLTNKNPDIFDEKCFQVIMKILKTQTDKDIICNSLKWIQKSCFFHEMNRQMIMNEEEFVKYLKQLLVDRSDERVIVKNVDACFRYLILDDDIRVEFGKAHDHARLIASECLNDLTGLMKKFERDAEILSDLMLTVSSLLVRNEYCQQVADEDGVKLIINAMVNSFENKNENMKVIRESFKLLKSLAGNDNVKAEIIKNGAAPIITVSLNQYKSDETIAKSALLCVSTLSLRVKENSTALWDTGIAEIILETMKIHETNKVVQRNGAWAIRNMVSRSRDQCKDWVALGAEDVLLNIMKNHPSIEQDVKAAMRDLGVEVKLIEEWKGNPEKVISDQQ